MRQHAIFDTEIIGSEKPNFLIKVKIMETGKRHTFWCHKPGHITKLEKMLADPKYIWVGFNSEDFDRPLIAAAIMGHDEHDIKQIAQTIIDERMRSWQTYREFKLDFLEYDHIDIKEIPPGVMMSLKTYEGRMHAPNLQDMPYHHDYDLSTPNEFKIVEDYCDNDVDNTERLFRIVQKEIALRIELGAQYDLDLRSKSDAQAAEAILKKVCGIANSDKVVPRHVQFTCPDFIKTDSPQINALIARLEDHLFSINMGNGSPEFPEFLTTPMKMNGGTYQFGIGGLHSQHDIRQHILSSDDLMCSDFDAAGYYPNIIMLAGLVPPMGGGKGERFIDTYTEIYKQRIKAKREGDKRMAGTLKIVLNGTYGKLGSIYCSFYAPELMLATCLIGQLNLMCLIYELEKIKDVVITSANTDGIMICYQPKVRSKVLKVIQLNAKQTGFEYEETPYSLVAMRDVNSYIAITEAREKVIVPPKGKLVVLPASPPEAKRRGAYAKAGVMENISPTFQVCATAVEQYLMHGTPVEQTIDACTEIEEFISIRNVKSGGVQHTKFITIDDWQLIQDNGNAKNLWQSPTNKKIVARKSRPKPYNYGVGGTPFGRVARWYMTTDSLPPITSVDSGNAVAGTTGGKLCMQLPRRLPKDLDYRWYYGYARTLLGNAGVPEFALFADELKPHQEEIILNRRKLK